MPHGLQCPSAAVPLIQAKPGAATQPLPSARQGSLGLQSISQSIPEPVFTNAQGEVPPITPGPGFLEMSGG